MAIVALLSGWHVHAKGYAKEVLESGNKIAVVWDEDIERGMGWAMALDAEFEADLDTVLSRDDIDGVVVNSPTNMHKDIMIKAARAGKHIFTEKVLSFTVADCNEIADEIKKAGVKFCISLPKRCQTDVLFAKKAIEDGLLGDITYMRVRNAHNGSSAGWLPAFFYDEKLCGGGAMMDLGAHPMYIISHLMGQPKAVSSSFTYVCGHEVEDNAVSVIEFDSGAIAVSETAFVSGYSPFSMEIVGTDGTLLTGGWDNTVRYMNDDTDKQWVIPELPEEMTMPIEQWLGELNGDDEIVFGIDDAIALTEMMEGAYMSHKENRKVKFSEINK